MCYCQFDFVRYDYALKKLTGCFNCTVVTLAANKLKRHMLGLCWTVEPIRSILPPQNLNTKNHHNHISKMK